MTLSWSLQIRKKERATEAVKRLEELYPEAICSLTYDDAFQLLIATRLSAQCTDKRVNMVTPALFAEFPDAKSMGEAPLWRVEELTTLPGVGRKTANLVCGDIYGKPAVVTDTHFIRLCNRLGLVETTNPLSGETQMRKLLPPEKSNGFCHRTVLFGRDVCTARKAHCDTCVLSDICLKKI